MTTFPRSPRLLKGAIIYYNLPDTTPNVIVFQYNPVSLTRTLQAQMAGEGERTGSARFKGAPVETISLDVEMDATDRLENAEKDAVSLGIHPQLAALELLLYPPSEAVTANIRKLKTGIIEIVSPMAPFILFVYGKNRILPVQLTDFRVTEEAHDVNLNPIRAKISLGLRVMSYNDLLPGHPGHAIFLAHQIAKEVLGRKATTKSLDSAIGDNIKIL